MRKLSIINYKGGTGKTSTVVNLAHGLALKGHRVLVIDMDPQGSATYHLGVSPKYTLYDLLLDHQDYKECIHPARDRVSLIGSNERTFPAAMLVSKMKNREQVLKKRLEHLKEFDYVLVDSGPSISLLNQNALLFSEEVLLPVSMDYLALVGVKQILKNIQIVNKIFSKQLKINKVIPTFYDKRNKKSKDVLESLHRVFPGLISVSIRYSVSIAEAAGYKQTIFEYAPHSRGAEDYLNLTKEVLRNGQR